jgi:hypothetical protein
MQSRLPSQFADLEPFVADWAIADETDRFHKRHTSTLEDVTEFYNVINPRIEEIGNYLDQFPIDDLPADGVPLLDLAHMCMEVFPAVELFKNVHIPQAYPWTKFEVVSPRRGDGSREE